MLHLGDCRTVMAGLDPESVEAVVCDPPYGLEFMGKGWDHGVPGVEFWTAALRVAKPGAHLLAFGGTRTHHRLMCAIEDAGWEVRDCVMWVYGSGFPKSHNGPWGGTALKPAWEPIIVARKPLDGTVAANVERHGCGGLNIDGCRVGTDDNLNGGAYSPGERGDHPVGTAPVRRLTGEYVQPSGRWPANLIHDGSDEATAGMGEAARYFYCAKASKADRDEGNRHPTVKPTALMRYLCRLVTPPGGTVLDPFMGSGSTGKAAVLEGFGFVGIEQDAEYLDIARQRIDHAREQAGLFAD